MRTKFQGKFYTGAYSAPYFCEVELRDHVVVVHVLDDFGDAVEILRWGLSNIYKDNLKAKHKTCVRHNTFPHQALEVEGREFPKMLNRLYPDSSLVNNSFLYTRSSKWKFLFLMILLSASLLFFFEKVVTPNMQKYGITGNPPFDKVGLKD